MLLLQFLAKAVCHYGVSHSQDDLRKSTPIQSLSTHLTPIGATAKMLDQKLPPAKLISTYLVGGTKTTFHARQASRLHTW